MKLTFIFTLVCTLLAGCHSAATSRSVAEQIDKLERQQAHVAILATNTPNISPDILQSIQAARSAFADYLTSANEQRRFLAKAGANTDHEYYQLQQQVLDAFAIQWHQVEVLLTQKP